MMCNSVFLVYMFELYKVILSWSVHGRIQNFNWGEGVKRVAEGHEVRGP